MTKNNEQIIIDGVDVSFCTNHYNGWSKLHRCNMPMCECGYDRECKPKHYECHHYVKCLETQLKRKEQECEEWKHQAELGVDTTDRLAKELEEKEQECDNLRGEISHYEHDLGWCSSLIELYDEKIMKAFYALGAIRLHNLKIKDKNIDIILKEVREDLKEYNKMKNQELDKKVKDE